MTANVQQRLQRALPNSVHLDESFILRNDKDIAQQYFELYKHRLQILRPSLKKLITQKWGSIKICSKILDCQNTKHNEVVIIGALYKHMDKKISPLDDLDNNNNDNKTNDTTNQLQTDLIGLNISKSDYLMLEDNYGSIKINGTCFNKDELLTGIVIGIRGSINRSNGMFTATAYLLSGLPSIHPQSMLNSNNNNDNKYVALVSGLEIATISNNNSISIQMLFDYLSGNLGNSTISSSICRLIIVGNIINQSLPSEDESIFYNEKFKKNNENRIISLNNSIMELDLWLSQLCSSLSIDIMPGVNDPSNELLPQQPFHQCLFPLSSSFNTFNRCTNPYKISINNRIFCGTSGQNFIDMMKHSKLNMIQSMELSLKSRIIAPTAPDTLSCFPFKNNDPFLINLCPNIYFSGNNDEYKVKYLKHPNDNQKICLLQVPSFRKTKQMVLLNLNNLQTQVVQFGVP